VRVGGRGDENWEEKATRNCLHSLTSHWGGDKRFGGVLRGRMLWIERLK